MVVPAGRANRQRSDVGSLRISNLENAHIVLSSVAAENFFPNQSDQSDQSDYDELGAAEKIMYLTFFSIVYFPTQNIMANKSFSLA